MMHPRMGSPHYLSLQPRSSCCPTQSTMRMEHASTCHLAVARTGRDAPSTLHSACGVAPTAKEIVAGG